MKSGYRNIRFSPPPTGRKSRVKAIDSMFRTQFQGNQNSNKKVVQMLLKCPSNRPEQHIQNIDLPRCPDE